MSCRPFRIKQIEFRPGFEVVIRVFVQLKLGTIVVLQPDALADVTQEGLESQFVLKRGRIKSAASG